MSRSRKHEFTRSSRILGRLQDIIRSLPSEEEKRQAREDIAALAVFLNDLKEVVEAMPTSDSLSQADEVLERVKSLFAKAEASSILGGLTRIGPKPSSRRDRGVVTDEQLARGKTDLQGLQSASAEEIRAGLLDENSYPLGRLRGIAAALEIRSPEKLSRESLAHQITARIANYRGYERLSGAQQAADRQTGTADSVFSPHREESISDRSGNVE